MPQFSRFAESVGVETAFVVLAAARRLKATGKDVVELEIGDSPFVTPDEAVAAGVEAIRQDHCHYGPSIGLPEFRQAAADYVNREYGLNVTAENVVAGQGAKPFQQFFCEAFVNPDDAVLVFSPHFPTYEPNILRRGARMVTSRLEQPRDFRPNLDDVARFVDDEPNARAIFLNSPQNPTGGVATADDLARLAELIRGRDIYLFSDEPYDQMVWRGAHHTPLSQPGMLEQCVAAYTFSKSFSMSGWRLGYAVSAPATIEIFSKMINTTLSCTPPFVQLAGASMLAADMGQRDDRMQSFRRKVERLAEQLNQLDGVNCLSPAGTFYTFPSVAGVCNRLGITSHGLAMFLLEAADDNFGVACLGGECFGEAGAGFIRFSCAESDERIDQAVKFLPDAFSRKERIKRYVADRPQFQLREPYPEAE